MNILTLYIKHTKTNMDKDLNTAWLLVSYGVVAAIKDEVDLVNLGVATKLLTGVVCKEITKPNKLLRRRLDWFKACKPHYVLDCDMEELKMIFDDVHPYMPNAEHRLLKNFYEVTVAPDIEALSIVHQYGETRHCSPRTGLRDVTSHRCARNNVATVLFPSNSVCQLHSIRITHKGIPPKWVGLHLYSNEHVVRKGEECHTSNITYTGVMCENAQEKNVTDVCFSESPCIIRMWNNKKMGLGIVMEPGESCAMAEYRAEVVCKWMDMRPCTPSFFVTLRRGRVARCVELDWVLNTKAIYTYVTEQCTCCLTRDVPSPDRPFSNDELLQWLKEHAIMFW
jgi:hypothetical protein